MEIEENINHCIVCTDTEGVLISIYENEGHISSFLRRIGIKLPQENRSRSILLCDDCKKQIKKFRDDFFKFTGYFQNLVDFHLKSGDDVSIFADNSQMPVDHNLVSSCIYPQEDSQESVEPETCRLVHCEKVVEKPLFQVEKSSTQEFSCDQCFRILCNRFSLSRHVNTVHPKSNLKLHVNSVHFNKDDHTCSVCQKAFVWKYNLKRHMIVHSADRPTFVCQVCLKSFKMKDSLKSHCCDGSKI